MSFHLHGDCELHSLDACGPAVWTVSVPTDDTHTVNPEINVGEHCVADAERYFEAQSFTGGFAQVDPLHYDGPLRGHPYDVAGHLPGGE